MSGRTTAAPALVPLPDRDSELFWKGCRDGKLLLQRCTSCGRYRYPPRPGCPHCTAPDAEWLATTGKGFVYSWFIAHHPVHPSVVDKVPYNVIMVQLDEGPRIVSQLVGADPGDIREGLRVEVVFEPVTPEISLPLFRVSPET